MVEMRETAAHPAPRHAPLAGHPRRDRPRHLDLRRRVDRLGGRRAPPRRASARKTLFATHYHELCALPAAHPRCDFSSPRASGRTRWCSCTSWCPAAPSRATASRWRGWPGCPAGHRSRARPSWRMPESEGGAMTGCPTGRFCDAKRGAAGANHAHGTACAVRDDAERFALPAALRLLRWPEVGPWVRSSTRMATPRAALDLGGRAAKKSMSPSGPVSTSIQGLCWARRRRQRTS